MPKEFLVTENGWRIPRWSTAEKTAAMLLSNRVSMGIIITFVDIFIDKTPEEKEELKNTIRKAPMRVNGFRDVTLGYIDGFLQGWIVSPGDSKYKISRIPTPEELNNYSNFRKYSRT